MKTTKRANLILKFPMESKQRSKSIGARRILISILLAIFTLSILSNTMVLSFTTMDAPAVMETQAQELYELLDDFSLK